MLVVGQRHEGAHVAGVQPEGVLEGAIEEPHADGLVVRAAEEAEPLQTLWRAQKIMPSRASLRRLVIVACIVAAPPFALARHEGCGGTAYQGNPCDVPDPFSTTSNTPPTVDMYWPGDVDLLFLTSRSPTTHLLVFSPDRMALDRRKLRGTLATGEAFNRSLGSMVLQQRACLLDKGSPYESCFEQPFGGQSWRGRPDRRRRAPGRGSCPR